MPDPRNMGMPSESRAAWLLGIKMNVRTLRGSEAFTKIPTTTWKLKLSTIVGDVDREEEPFYTATTVTFFPPKIIRASCGIFRCCFAENLNTQCWSCISRLAQSRHLCQWGWNEWRTTKPSVARQSESWRRSEICQSEVLRVERSLLSERSRIIKCSCSHIGFVMNWRAALSYQLSQFLDLTDHGC